MLNQKYSVHITRVFIITQPFQVFDFKKTKPNQQIPDIYTFQIIF